MRNAASSAVVLLAVALASCASAPLPPYPAFTNVADVPDTFDAGLPGIRAKRLVSSPETRSSSNVLTLPADWQFTTGGFPDKSVEIYVMVGQIKLGDFDMGAGGYAYLPSGTAGLSLTTENGARILYFLDDAIPASVIQTPLIASRDLMTWRSTDSIEGFGLSEKVLREDPGSGARTWLLRIDPGAVVPWQKSTVVEEGLLLEGSYRHAECVAGEAVVGEYGPGGYFQRPADTVNGGPESAALAPSVWYLRRLKDGETVTVAGCS